MPTAAPFPHPQLCWPVGGATFARVCHLLATAPNDPPAGSIRWICPLGCPSVLSVGSGRQPRHQLQPAGRHLAHSISSGDGLDWDCPLLFSSSLPSRGRGSASRPRRVASLSDRLASGAGPARAIAESLIPVRLSFLGLTGVKGGAPARTGGRREGPACRGATGGPALPRPP